MTGTTTAADYEWLEELYPDLMEAYCLTLIRDITPETLLSALNAAPAAARTGVDALQEPSFDAWDDHAGDKLFVGITPIGDWSLLVEFNGYLGTTPALAALSRGRTVVSHFRNVNAVDHFYWYEDGELRLHFEPLFAHDRAGSRAEEISTVMRESGFDLSEEDDRDYDAHTEAAFALAHRLTGVHITPELFETAEFTCGLVPLPRA
ncbi:DUF6461 domain-containing protein [Nocardia goodfellowii]|uniref:Uncharacterized protein n=1 Tax=Nocardia goodfellowii TaxID=882446 RepID=A0ABS4QEY2_9NOCA|nr:DUF6461 domain-containing protein [Nocardia goodfellowii]MBP2190267.1 hypothetical protein [Nocardia goodfellowii]